MSEEKRTPMEEAGNTHGFRQVVQKIHAIDPESEYDNLIKHLDPDPSRSEFGVIYSYADRAESMARKALQLLAVAKVEHKVFEHHRALEEATMRSAAMAELQDEKANGIRSKQITDSDVKARMIELFPTAMSELEEEAQRVANAVDVLEKLANVASLRCRTAQTMLSSVRR